MLPIGIILTELLWITRSHTVLSTRREEGQASPSLLLIIHSTTKLSIKLKPWELKTDITVGRWQEIVMTWHKGKGIAVFVNGAFKEAEKCWKKDWDISGGTTRLIIGREKQRKGTVHLY